MLEAPQEWRCPICEADTAHGKFDLMLRGVVHPLLVYRCVCGLGYTNLAIKYDHPDLYDASYYQHQRYVSDSGRKAYVDHLGEFFTKYAMTPDRRPESVRVLDVGCATGDFVSWALNKGFEVEGIDISADAIREGRKRGLPLRNVDIFAAQSLGDKLYDIITMWDVIEHLEAPEKAIAIIRRNLVPNGVLLLKTVSNNSFLELTARAIYRVSCGSIQVPLKKIYVPGHLYYFTAALLSRLLEQAGLKDVTVLAGDTPAEALFSSSVVRFAYGFFVSLHRFSNKGYELFSAARNP